MLLTEGEKCVCEIADKVDAQQPTVSKHLSVLRDAGILASRKDGLMVYYRVRVPCIQGFSLFGQSSGRRPQKRQAHLEEGGYIDGKPATTEGRGIRGILSILS